MDEHGIYNLEPLAAELAKHVFWNAPSETTRHATIDWG